MPRASLRTIRRERRKSRSEQRFRRTSVSRKFLLAGDTNTLRVSLRAADIERRPDNFGRSYPRFGGARQEGPVNPGAAPIPAKNRHWEQRRELQMCRVNGPSFRGGFRLGDLLT